MIRKLLVLTLAFVIFASSLPVPAEAAVRVFHKADDIDPGIFGSGNIGDFRFIRSLFIPSGSVGINTTSPTEKLHVWGNIRIQGEGNGIIFPDGSKQTNASGSGGGSGSGGSEAAGWTDDGAAVRLTTATDKVGIGTISPGSAKLNVTGNVYTDSNVTAQYFIGDGTYLTNVPEADTLQTVTSRGRTTTNNVQVSGFNATGQTLLATGSGNVGIGTTSPNAKLDVSGGNILLSNNNGLIMNKSGGGSWTAIASDTNNDLVSRSADGSVGWVVDATSGNVGIGTTEPDEKLEVAGGGIIIPNNNPYQSKDTGGTIRTLMMLDSANNLELRNAANGGQMKFTDGTNTNLFIESGGNVGIGAISPAQKLAVQGTFNVTGPTTLNQVTYTWPSSGGTWGQVLSTDVLGQLSWSDRADLSVVSQWDNTTSQIFVRRGYPYLVNISNTAFVDGNSGNVGIGTTNPSAKLQVSDGTVWFNGTTGSTPTSGAGTRFMWIPSKGALRAGEVVTSNPVAWDSANIGTNSIALGGNVVASKTGAFAVGGDADASNSYSIAMGTGVRSSGDKSIAMGQYVTAGPAANTIVIGQGTFTNRLTNNIASSFMIGFNSDIPTLFVGPSSGVGTTGNVGIGTTSPNAKLDVSGGNILLSNNNGLIMNKSGGGSWAAIASDTNNDLVSRSADGSVGWVVDATSGNVGIGTASPNAKLQVSDGTVWFNGTTGPTPTSGAGTRFMWIPAKGALRAGAVGGTQWDDVDIGTNSTAFGYNTKASGQISTAMGVGTIASGSVSTAMGGSTIASGSFSTAIGVGTTASGQYSTAMGYLTIASGQFSTAMGQYVTAGSAANTIVLGMGVDNNNKLVNNVAQSLMVGFNSNIPTLFVGPSSGIGTTGNVGIGTASPETSLHVITPNDNTGGIFVEAFSDTKQSAVSFRNTTTQQWLVGSRNAVDTPNNRFFIQDNAGTHVVTVLQGGKVGIGTASPTNKLHVKSGSSGATADTNNQIVAEGSADAGINILSGASNLGRLMFGDSGSNFAGMVDYDHALNKMTFGTSGSYRMAIDTSGNVGVGTNDPTKRLSVKGAIEIGPTTNDAINALIRGDSGIVRFRNTADTDYVDVDGATLVGRKAITVPGTETSYIMGNVGIGTNDPQARLHVVGGPAWFDVGRLSKIHNVGGAVEFEATNDPVALDGNGGIYFRTSGTEMARIDADGDLGIGTINPIYKLDVSGKGRFTDDVLFEKNLIVIGNITNVDANSLNVNGSLIPPEGFSGVFDIGNATRQWRDGYFARNFTIGSHLTVDTNTLFVDAVDDRIGIGTTNPGTTLDVNGIIRTTGNEIDVKGSSPRITGIDAGGTTQFNMGYALTTTNVLDIQATNNNAVKFSTTSTDGAMTILNGGKVGIGTTDPNSKLVVTSSGTPTNPGTTGKTLQLQASGDQNIHITTDGTTGTQKVNFGDSGSGTMGAVGYIHDSDSMIFWTNNGEKVRIDSSGNVGIGTASPNAKLQVSDGTVWFNGTTGPTPTSGAGTRFMWIPAKGALRAGAVGGTQWDSANIGTNSTAFGYNTKASGLVSTAMGQYTTASGQYSTAMGTSTIASGYMSTAMGSLTTASGLVSTAMGSYTIASGSYSTAMGDTTTASGSYSTAMGRSTIASGSYSTAMGQYVTAGSAANTIVLGMGVDNSNKLVNNVARSLMVGFNSNIPTLFVGPSSGVGTTGNVGIGTTSPNAKLDVSGGNILLSNNNGLIMNKSGGGSWTAIASDTNNDLVSRSADGSVGWVVDATSGNVGIGTNSPGHKLEIDNGNVMITDKGNKLYFEDTSTYIEKESSNKLHLFGGKGMHLESYEGNVTMNISSWPSSGAGKGYAINLKAGKGGNLTGTSSGAGGNVVIESGSAQTNDAGGNINLKAGKGGIVSGVGGDVVIEAGSSQSSNNPDGNVIFMIDNTEIMRVDGSAGNVGIGAKDPDEKLEIRGTSSKLLLKGDSVTSQGSTAHSPILRFGGMYEVSGLGQQYNIDVRNVMTKGGANPESKLTVSNNGTGGLGVGVEIFSITDKGGVKLKRQTAGVDNRPPCTGDVDRGMVWFETATPDTGDTFMICMKDPIGGQVRWMKPTMSAA